MRTQPCGFRRISEQYGMKQTLIFAGVALGISALYFHVIGPAVMSAMSSKPADPAAK